MTRLFNTPSLIIMLLLFVSSLMNNTYSSPIEWAMSRLLILPAVIIGLSFHEYAHALAAVKLGDNTPRFQGRLTVNPAAHIDFVGFACLLLIGFGWGKPVQIEPRNFKNWRRDDLIVSLAGVTMNLILAIVFMGIWSLLYTVIPGMMFSELGDIISEVIQNIIVINLVLMLFNLLPVPPLDGFSIVTQIFNLENTRFYWQLYNNGSFILLILILFDITDKLLTVPLNVMYNLIAGIFF